MTAGWLTGGCDDFCTSSSLCSCCAGTLILSPDKRRCHVYSECQDWFGARHSDRRVPRTLANCICSRWVFLLKEKRKKKKNRKKGNLSSLKWCKFNSGCCDRCCTSNCAVSFSATSLSRETVGLAEHSSTNSRLLSPFSRSPFATRPTLITPCSEWSPGFPLARKKKQKKTKKNHPNKKACQNLTNCLIHWLRSENFWKHLFIYLFIF